MVDLGRRGVGLLRLHLSRFPANPEGASLSYIGYALHTNPRLSEVLGRTFRRVYRRICMCASRNADD